MIVVEGFIDCMNVWQSGRPSVVALMGSSLSERQERLLVGRFQKVTLLLDGDDAGRTAAGEIAARLIRRVHVRIVEPPDGKQPDQLDHGQLNGLLGYLRSENSGVTRFDIGRSSPDDRAVDVAD